MKTLIALSLAALMAACTPQSPASDNSVSGDVSNSAGHSECPTISDGDTDCK